MPLFTMINKSEKLIGEEKEFKSYIEAGKYCKENYGEGWESKHDPFHFSSSVYEFLFDGSHPAIKTDNAGRKNAIISNDTVYHCGYVTMGDLDYMRKAGIKTKWISKREFIEMHNELLTAVLN